MSGVEFVDKIRELVLQKIELRKELDQVSNDVNAVRDINRKIFDCNYEINKLFKDYMGQ